MPAFYPILDRGDYSHVLFPANTFGKDLMPRVAALLGTQPISDVTAVLSETTFVRSVGELERKDACDRN